MTKVKDSASEEQIPAFVVPFPGEVNTKSIKMPLS